MFNIKWRVVVARTLIIVLAGNPLIMAAHGIENVQLAAGQQAAKKRSANGTEVIDIAAPSQKGVSHNKFNRFNVSPDGVILNNSQGPAQSVLGGWTDGNRRLAGGTASLILAEVISSERSSLKGYTEVLGDSAEFVLANPNGISCNGCGFINTPRVTLATGVPDLMNGSLMGFDITGGDVSIEGAGLNASNVSKFDILTRAMRLNAALYANELNIRTGSNYYDFNTLQARKSSNQPDNADYQFALDASNLGAMYANTISLIGTEAGLGVRSKGLISSTDSLALTADGRLELKNTIAGGDLALRSKNADVITHGTTYGKDVSIKLADTLQNNGIIAAADRMDITAAELQQNGHLIAGLSQQGDWLDGASQQLNVSGTIVNRGRIISQGQQQLSAKELKNTSGSLLQANATTVNTKKLANSGVLNSNALTIKTETAQNAGHIQAQELAIDAQQFKQTQGVVYQAGPNGQLSFTGKNLQLDGGVLVADGDSQINASGNIRNKGTWVTAGESSITAKALQNTGNGIMTAGQLNIDAAAVTNDSDALIEATQAKLKTKSMHNAGTLLATGEQGDSLLLQTDELTNRGRIESHGENLTLSNVKLDNRQGQIYQHGTGVLQLEFLGDLRNSGGEIYSGGQLNIAGGNVDNTNGTIASHGRDLNLTLNNLSNDNGDLLHLGAGSFTLSQDETLTNSGTIASAGNLILNAESVANDGVLQAQQQLQLNADLMNQSDALLQANDITVNAIGGDIINDGSISADNDLKLNAKTLNNSQLLYGGNNAEVTAETMTNSGTLAATHLTVSDFDLLQNSGRIESESASYTGGSLDNLDSGVLVNAGTEANGLKLNVADLNNAGTVHNSSQNMSLGGNLDNSGSIIHAGSGKLVLGSNGSIHNAGGSIASAGKAKLQSSVIGAGSVYAGQGMELAANNGTLVNNSQLYTEGDMLVSSGLNNQGGILLSDGNLTINTSDNVTNSGTLQGKNLDLTAGVLDNNAGVITSTGNGSTQIDTASLSNNSGVIQSTNDNFTITTHSGELDNSDGQISHNGGSLSLESASDLNQQSGVVQSSGQLIMNAQGSLDNREGTLAANGGMQMAGGDISNNDGIIAAGGQLEITAGQLNNDNGTLNAEDIGIELVGNLRNNQGTVFATDKLNIDAATLDNSLGTLASNGEMELNLTNTLTNLEGLIQANAIELSSLQDLNNNGGTIASAGNLLLNAEQVNNAGRISAENNLELNAVNLSNSQLLYGGNNAAVNAETMTNSGTLAATHLTVSDFDLLQNSGRIESDSSSYTGNTLSNLASGVLINAGTTANSLQLDVADLNNAGTVHNSSQNMSLSGNLTNSGNMIHAGTGDLVLGNNGSIRNANGSIASAGTAKLQNSVIGEGSLYAAQGMELGASSGTFVNNSQLYTKGNIQVNSALDNQGGSLLSDGNLSINTSDSVTNSGSLQGQNLDLKAGALNNNTGVITSTGSESAQIDAASLSNSGGVIQATNDNFTITTRSGELNNSNGQISHNGSKLTLDSASHFNQQSGVVQSTGQLAVNAEGDLNNTNGVLTGSQYQLTSGGTLNNNDGRIVGSGSGASSVESGALLNRSGYIAANGNNLTLNTAALDNNAGSILLAGTGNLDITASSVASDAASSRIISNGAINLNGGTELKNAGQISSAKQLTLNAKTIGNSGTLASRAGKVDIDSSGTLTNSGTVSGATAVDLDVRTLNNRNGKVQSDGTVAINVNSLTVGQIQARDITLDSNNSIALQNNESISAGGNIDLNTKANINNSGTIVASGILKADAKELANKASGLIRSGGNATLDANKLTNNGTVSSNSVLRLDIANTSNTGTLAAGTQLDINGNINNSNLLFASNLLTIDGNVSNTGNIYSNRDASIAGSTVTNTGGSIAAARDLSISGKILNTYTGDFSYTAGSPTTTTVYPNGNPRFMGGTYSERVRTFSTTREKRTSRTYKSNLNGKAGVIAAGRNLGLSGDITNDFGTISAVGNLVLSGSNLTNNSAQSRKETEVTVIRETWEDRCLQGYSEPNGRYLCAEPGMTEKIGETETDTYTEVTYIDGGSYGTITAGNITGNLSGSVELNDITPAKAAGHNVNTKAGGSRGSASRGSSADNNSGTKVVVLRNNGNAQDTDGANRSDVDTGTTELDWRNNDVRPTSPESIEVAVSPHDASAQNITAAERLADSAGNTTMPASNDELINTSSPNKLGANSSGIGVQDLGFMTPDMADSLRMSQGVAPEAPGKQQGVGEVSNGNIANNTGQNPDLIIKGLVDDQKGTLARQKESIQQQKNTQQQGAGQRAGQNVFMTDEQMRVLTEDLGFDADAINKGQQGLYSAISQNDLLEDGVTLSASGIIDITADAGLNIDSGIAAGEGLILRSDAGLNMGDYGHFDSDNLLGLQLGGDFTNDMSLESDTLWFDIGGDFTNQGDLTGNNILSINAGDDLINQSLLSGGNVMLNAGGDIVNRTEFTQHTYERNNGDSRTYTVVGDRPEIISGESLSMNAGNNLDLQGSQLGAAGDISLHAGNDVLLNAVEKVRGHEKYFKGGYDIELDRTYDVVSLEAGGNLSVVAGNNLQSEGAQFVGGGNVELAAGNEMNLLGVVEYHEDRDKRTKKSTFKKKVYIDETYSAEHHGSVVAAGGNVSLNAQQSADGLQLFNSGDVFLEGAYLQAGGDVVAYSGGQLDMVSGEEWQAENHIKKKSMFGGLFGSTKISETDVQYLGHAELNAGGDIALLAENDINVLAGRMNAENITAQAGFGNEGAQTADINILGDTETSSLYQETRRNGLALGFSDNFLSVAKETANENRITQTDYIGSAFTAKNNMALSASRDVNVVGSELYAGNNLQVDAGRDINVTTGQGSGSSYSRETETKTGIAVSADSNTLSVFAGDDTQKDALTSDSITQTGSTLTAGNNVQLNAGNDLLISGSDVVAGQDASLIAANDINIVTAQELFNQETKHSSTRDGLTVSANYNIGKTVDAISNLGQGDDAVSVASSVMEAADTLNNAGPSAGAHFGQTTETTTDNMQQSQAKASSLTAGRDVVISAGGDALLEGVNTNAGRDIGINAENVSIVAAQNSSDSQHNTEYLQVGLNLNASTSNVSLTAGFSKSDSELDNQNTSAVGSNLNAGGNVDINARNDLAVVGSDINGDDNVALTAGNNIVIEAAESQYSSDSEDSHLSAGAGINFGSDGIGFTANMAMGEGELDREGTTYSNSHITAGNNLSVTSGNDTVIEGGNLAGTDVAMDVGGDLTVASVQDTGQVKGDRWDVSANITVGMGVSGGASAGYGETDGSSAWVNEQSSIIGSGSVDIRTEGHTQIDGAAIANIDEEGNDGGNLSLSTGTLAYSDIEDHDQEKSTYLNVGFTMGDDNSTNQSESGTNYTASGHYNNHDKEQINRATVGEGTITVRENEEQDLSDLNRDTELAQEVTKDDSQNTNLYASTTAADSLTNLVENPSQQLNQWKENVTSVLSPEAWKLVGENTAEALEEVSEFVANLNKLSPEQAAVLNEKMADLHAFSDTLLNSDDAGLREVGKKLAEELDGAEELILAQQALPPEDDRQIADAPASPKKSIEELAAEFEFVAGERDDYYESIQENVDEAFETGVNRGLHSYSQSERTPAVGSDAYYDDAISFLKSQRESARNNLGLDAGAPDGGFSDFVGWTAASITNESWQAVQFLGKAGAYGITWGSTSSPLDGSSYHSLIGDDTLFGSPQTFTGAVGVEQGVVASYFVGGEGVLLAGVKGVKYVGGAKTADKAGDVVKGDNDSVDIFRVFGGDARAQGFSWTTVDPRTVSNFRDAAGLPSGGASGSTNTADFLIKGEAKLSDIIKSRSALPLDGNKGGLPELIIDPKNVNITDFSVIKP